MIHSEKDKEKFLTILAKNAGNVSAACNAFNITRQTYYNWVKDEGFKANVDEIQESLIDNAESKLQKLINEDSPVAILFYLKTRAKSRGYIERQETDITSKGEKISININLDD